MWEEKQGGGLCLPVEVPVPTLVPLSAMFIMLGVFVFLSIFVWSLHLTHAGCDLVAV